MIYLVILVVLLLLAYIYDIIGIKKNANLWYRFMLLVFILLAGLRWRVGGDTPNYLYDYYYLTPDFSHCSYEDFFYREPLFSFLNIMVKSFNLKFFVVQIIQASIVNILIFKYIKNTTAYPFAAIALYFLWIYVFLNFEEMRAGISVAISLFANNCVIDGKWKKGMALFILTTLFHYSSILLIFTSVLSFLKINKYIVIPLIIAFLIGNVVQQYIGEYLFLFESDDQVFEKIQNYSTSESYFSQSLNWKGFLVTKFPFIFYSLFSYYYIKRYSDKRIAFSILRLQPFVMMGLIWMIVSIPVPICIRYTRFYELYFILFFSYSFVELVRNSIKTMKSLSYVRAFLLYLPLFFLICRGYFSMQTEKVATPFVTYRKYLPYRSIFTRGDNHEFEKQCNWRTHAKDNEY